MDLDLQNKEWREFRIGDIFEVSKGIYLTKKKIKSGNIPYITAKSVNNGITNFIENTPLFGGNSITIGKVDLSAYYQPKSFYCSHDVSVIVNKYLNKLNGQFICNMINRQGFKYSYGRQAQLNVVTSEKVFLPVDSKGNPNYVFMEAYMKDVEQKMLGKYKQFIEKRLSDLNIQMGGMISFDSKGWKEFYLQDIFNEMQRGKRLKKADHKIGKIPYVSSTATSNGIDGFISNNQSVRVFQNCLTIANSGSVGATFYHSYSFVASDHVTKLENGMLSEHVYKFISVMLNRMGTKYSFNREINDARIKREKIMFPVNQAGAPDYEFMENYMKRLECISLEKYLSYKDLG